MNKKEIYISVCIPAYKRVDFLKRLLDSIATQSFQQYEVIISDDSPGNEVENLLVHFKNRLPAVIYHKNEEALGTPANWNEAIRRARGTWIKIMHDDDWFNGPVALEKFALAARKEEQAMLFSSYYDVFLSTGREKRVRPGVFRFRQLIREPVTLLSKNIIGPPSVIMHRNDGSHHYDPKLKWLVDIDMYVRRLQHDRVVYLPEPLVKVGIGDEQVTASVHGNPQVEVPEHFYFLMKTGADKLKHVLVYDYWWRFLRNFNLLSAKDVQESGYEGRLHPVVLSMMRWQKSLPRPLLRTGLFSKAVMFIHFCLYRKKLFISTGRI